MGGFRSFFLLNLCFSWWLRKEGIFSPLRFLNGENTTCNQFLWVRKCSTLGNSESGTHGDWG